LNQETLKKYAHTLLKYGVNLQEDQTLVISVDVENKEKNKYLKLTFSLFLQLDFQKYIVIFYY